MVGAGRNRQGLITFPDAIPRRYGCSYSDRGLAVGARPRCEAPIAVSVVLFRLHNTGTPHVIERLKIALGETKEMLEAGSIVVVEESRLRVRRLPLRE